MLYEHLVALKALLWTYDRGSTLTPPCFVIGNMLGVLPLDPTGGFYPQTLDLVSKSQT